jgi:RNA polymerase sigma-B factor
MAYNRDDYEDLIQVGTIGLLKSLERFKPSKDVDFATFATPNIIGEIKHYFRDKGNLVKIPRRLQELNTKIKNYIKIASQDNGYSPTIKELAEHLGVNTEDILEAMEAGQSSKVISLDSTVFSDNNTEDETISLIDSLGVASNDENLLNGEGLKTALSKLGEREKSIITMHFYDGLTQREISMQFGISQMHVSRLLMFAIKELRKHLGIKITDKSFIQL